MKHDKFILGALLMLNFQFSILNSSAQSVYPGQHEGKITQPPEGEIKAYSFDLKDVRLLDSPFRQNMERESQWIMSLSADRLLHSFRTSAGMYAGKENVRLEPVYKIHRQRYVVYWNINNK